MARSATGDREALEAEIGPRGSTKITSENRNEVRQWLRARGCPAEVTQTLVVSILDKAYNDEANFAELVGVIDTTIKEAQKQEQEPMPQANPFTPAAIQDTRANRFPGECSTCAIDVPAFAGMLVKEAGRNLVYCKEHAPKAEPFKAAEPFKIETKIETPPSTPKPHGAEDIGTAIARAIAAVIAAQPPVMDEAKIIELIKTHGSQPIVQETTITITVPPADPITLDKNELRHEAFPDVLTEIIAGSHVYLVGPAGSGKSTLAYQIATATKRKFYSTNAVKSAFGLVGYMNATGAYVRTQFRDAFEHGGVFLFDEIDASSADAIVTLNGALAQSWFAFPDSMIERHADFVCIAGANTYGSGQDRQYVGRNQLDAASLDRFAFIEMNYDERLEDKLCANQAWVNCVRAVRNAVASLKLRHVISPRASIGGAKSLAAGKAWNKVRAAWLYKGLDEPTVEKIAAQAGPAINAPRQTKEAV